MDHLVVDVDMIRNKFDGIVGCQLIPRSCLKFYDF